jgi:Mrr restriction endonuclease-like protein
MMPVIRVSDATWERLKAYAKPFEDKPEDIVNLALDALDEKTGRTAPPKPETQPLSEQAVGGKKLPQKEFRMPLMKTMLELGGSAHVSEIRKVMQRKMAPLLSEADYQPVKSGEERWWNAICWERADLVREGLFLDHSERGVWELSEKGKSLVHKRSTD